MKTMVGNKKLLGIGAVFCLLLVQSPVPSAFSQSDSNSGFFDPGHVGSEANADPEEEVTPAHAVRTPSNTKKEMDVKGSGFFEFEEKTPEQKNSKEAKVAKDEIIPDAVDKGEQIQSIELLVSSESTASLEKLTADYARLIRTRDVEGKGITVLLKDLNMKETLERVLSKLTNELTTEEERKEQLTPEQVKNLSPQEVRAAVARSVQSPLMTKRIQSLMMTHAALEIPKEYPVQKLPTWVLHTEKGAILLEGLENPGELITRNGKFIEPQGISGGG